MTLELEQPERRVVDVTLDSGRVRRVSFERRVEGRGASRRAAVHRTQVSSSSAAAIASLWLSASSIQYVNASSPRTASASTYT